MTVMRLSLLVALALAGPAFMESSNDSYHSIFGGKWYAADTSETGTPKITSSSFEWDIHNHTHFGNAGFVTFFDKVEVKEGTKYIFQMGWKSYGWSSDFCDDKYHEESEYDHQCADPSSG
jgi:hypothetical protein